MFRRSAFVNIVMKPCGGVTVYSTVSPNRWRQDKFFGFKKSFGLLLSTIMDYFWKIKFFHIVSETPKPQPT